MFYQPHGLSAVGLRQHGVVQVTLESSLENHPGKSLSVVVFSGGLDLVDEQAVQEVNESGKIHRLTPADLLFLLFARVGVSFVLPVAS